MALSPRAKTAKTTEMNWRSLSTGQDYYDMAYSTRFLRLMTGPKFHQPPKPLPELMFRHDR